MITFEKLWPMLKEKKLNKTWLWNNGMSKNQINYLTKNMDVRISTINELCNLLECKPEDILTYTPDEEEHK